MKFSKQYSKLVYPIFTTIRQNKGYYNEGQVISVSTPETGFKAEIVSIRKLSTKHFTETIALRDADCSKGELMDLMHLYYKQDTDDLILITLMKV